MSDRINHLNADHSPLNDDSYRRFLYFSILMAIIAAITVVRQVNAGHIGAYFYRDIIAAFLIVASMNMAAQMTSKNYKSLNWRELSILMPWSIVLSSLGNTGEVLINHYIVAGSIISTGFWQMLANTFIGFIIATIYAFIQKFWQTEKIADGDLPDKMLDIYFIKLITALVFNFLKSVLIPLELRGLLTIIKQVPDRFFQMWALKRPVSIFRLSHKVLWLVLFACRIINLLNLSKRQNSAAEAGKWAYDKSQSIFNSSDNRIKSLHVVTHFKVSGGITKAAAMLARLSPANHCTAIITGDTPDEEVWESLIHEMSSAGVKMAGVVKGLAINAPKPFLMADGLWQLHEIFAKEKPQIVFTHNSFLPALAARLAGVKTVVMVHHTSYFFAFEAFGHFKGKLSSLVDRYTAGLFCDHIICASRSAWQERLQHGWPPQKTSWLNLPVELKENSKTATEITDIASQIGERKPVIVTVARIDPLKGYDYLITALSEIVKSYPDTVLVAAGRIMTQPYLASLQNQAERLGITQNIIFAGHVENIASLLNLATVFVLPSLSESFSMVAVEASMAGLPVIASDVGDIRHHITEGETGYVVPPADSTSLVEALHKIFSDLQKASLMGKAGQKKMQQQYSTASVKAGFVSLLEKLSQS